jgi:Predicted AAA-ATPase/PD-(D/E)XK nuclease superfamily
MKSLPIGISDYKELIEGGYYYVDKTLLIKELLDVDGKVMLIPRPRRFGKTLNLSMLQYFFDCSDVGTNNDHLFYGTHIWNYSQYKAHQGQYPIISITFKNSKAENWTLAYHMIELAIAEEYNRHKYLLKDTTQEQFEVEKFRRIQSSTASQAELSDSIYFLSKLLSRYHNRRVIILLDEYDIPIHAAYSHGYYAQIINFIRLLLTTALKDNRYLQRGILTGILHTAKEGIFSGLNNINVFNLTNAHFADKFGFTQPEVKQLLSDMHIEKGHHGIKEWYDGYTFGSVTGIYNPWSILNCIHNNGSLELYWVNTSDNLLIKKVIAQADKTVKSELELLLTGNILVQEIDESITLPEIEHNQASLWSLLLYTGYLTYTTCEIKGGKKVCSLTIPNNEIYYLYVNLIKTIFAQSIKAGQTEDLLQALTQGNTIIFSQLLQSFVLTSMSMYDLPSNEPEKSYHLFVLGLLVILSDRYEVKSNRESGFGRYDIMLIPKTSTENGIIIEFKKALQGETLEVAAQKALDQIVSKVYVQELHARDISTVIAYGIAFEGKKIFIKSQKIP